MSLSLPKTDFIVATYSAAAPGRDNWQVGALAVEARPRVEGRRGIGHERGLLFFVEDEALVGVLADHDGLVGVQLSDVVPVGKVERIHSVLMFISPLSRDGLKFLPRLREFPPAPRGESRNLGKVFSRSLYTFQVCALGPYFLYLPVALG